MEKTEFYKKIKMLKKIDYNNLTKTTWCSMPWLHLFIDPEGRVKPCCRFMMDKKEEKRNNLKTNNLQEIFSNSFMDDIRSKMIQNKRVKGCLRCYQEETSNKQSLRERYNQLENLHPSKFIADLKKPKIRWIELAISNDCNLACRMCDSRYSTKWFDDEQEFYGKTFSQSKKTKCNINQIIPFLKNLTYIKFTGGEPLMIPDHFVLINKLLKLKNVDNIFLNYNTNLTIKPSKSLIEKWKQFKYIEIICSFDGIGPTWEFVRYPSRWKKTEKILQYFFQLTQVLDCRIGIRSTISVNNILGMTASFKWWIKNWSYYAMNKQYIINPTHLTFPRFLSTTVFPEKYKNIVADKLIYQAKQLPKPMKSSIESQINYMFSKDDSKYLNELKNYTLHFDKKREQSFFKVNPELKGIFDKVS